MVEWKYPVQQVTGPCAVVFNTTDNHLWCAAHYHAGGYVYIWAEHLNYFARTGNCYPILCGVPDTNGPPPPIRV